ncbi:MAG: cell division protein FtsX [Campylobacterales bacterium]|nr:cell division protein FtsX [Campylobacterales bacterium]
MKSFKNHFSLVIALLGILFSLQVFFIVDRAVLAYKENLAKHYSLVLVSQKTLVSEEILKLDKNFSELLELSPDSVIKELNSGFSQKNIELLKLTLPKFYKLKLRIYPSPKELADISQKLLKNSSIGKVETFSKTHDTTYKLLLLFKTVITVFAATLLIVTILLIFKELRIWQFKHSERMSIMGLFGAPVWLRSAVLFRLAIVDALIATLLSFLLFSYISTNDLVLAQFESIGIEVTLFNTIEDSLIMLGVSMVVSILLATFIVLGHKEEV